MFFWNTTGVYSSYTSMFGDDLILSPGLGYWFYAHEDVELWAENVSSCSWNNTVGLLAVGWNDVGIPCDENISLGELEIVWDGDTYNWSEAVSGGLVESSVFFWNTTGVYSSYTSVFGVDAFLSPGLGYWFYAHEGCWLRKG